MWHGHKGGCNTDDNIPARMHINCTNTKGDHLETAPVGDMFQHKMDEISKEPSNCFGIADDISVVQYDNYGRNHNRTLRQVIKMCHTENLKLNEKKCYLMCMRVPFLAR